jgi:hypothetical protein
MHADDQQRWRYHCCARLLRKRLVFYVGHCRADLEYCSECHSWKLLSTYAWAYAPSTLNSDVISCGSEGGYTLDAVAIAGANTSSPIDADSPVDSASTASPLSINTASANTLIINALANQATVGSGWTLIDGGSSNYWSIEYQIVSSAGTNSGTWGSGTGSGDPGFAVAIVAASGGGGGAALASIAIPKKIATEA